MTDVKRRKENSKEVKEKEREREREKERDKERDKARNKEGFRNSTHLSAPIPTSFERKRSATMTDIDNKLIPAVAANSSSNNIQPLREKKVEKKVESSSEESSSTTTKTSTEKTHPEDRAEDEDENHKEEKMAKIMALRPLMERKIQMERERKKILRMKIIKVNKKSICLKTLQEKELLHQEKRVNLLFPKL